VGRRLRIGAGLLALAELVVYVLLAQWIGLGWTILATLATSALGAALLGRQLKDPTAPRRSHARAGTLQWGRLGDVGLIAVGGLLMLLPGFLGDLVGLLCLLPGTRRLVRAVLVRTLYARLPGAVLGPVKVRSARVEAVDGEVWRPGRPTVIEGEIAPGPPPATPTRS
jgi:UPF0716 protein FxsA